MSPVDSALVLFFEGKGEEGGEELGCCLIDDGLWVDGMGCGRAAVSAQGWSEFAGEEEGTVLWRGEMEEAEGRGAAAGGRGGAWVGWGLSLPCTIATHALTTVGSTVKGSWRFMSWAMLNATCS